MFVCNFISLLLPPPLVCVNNINNFNDDEIYIIRHMTRYCAVKFELDIFISETCGNANYVYLIFEQGGQTLVLEVCYVYIQRKGVYVCVFAQHIAVALTYENDTDMKRE